MKKLLLTCILFFALQISSQEKQGRPFFTIHSSFVLGINENYTLATDDGEPLIIPTGIFFRAGLGYEFRRRIAISLNAGYDYHWNYATSAFPTYTSLKYNITENDDDTLFLELSYGKMWRPSRNYPDGSYYGFGIGVQAVGLERWNTIVRLDFHRKSIFGFKNNRIDSVSFGIGFSFF